MRYFHAAGSSDGRKGMAQSAIARPTALDDPESRQPIRMIGLQYGVPRGVHQRREEQQPDDQGMQDHSVDFRRGSAE